MKAPPERIDADVIRANLGIEAVFRMEALLAART